MPVENSRAAASISDRILPKGARDRFERKANAQTSRALLFCGRCDANRRPSRTSKAETHLLSPAIRPRLLLRVDNEAPNRLASVRARSLRSFREYVCPKKAGIQQVAS